METQESVTPSFPWKTVGGILLVLAVIANIAVLDYWIVTREPVPNQRFSPLVQDTSEKITAVCPASCIDVIKEATSAITASPFPAQSPVVTAQQIARQEPREYYVPLAGGGSTTKRDWVDIGAAETYLDTSRYPSAITVTWDASLKILSGNGHAFARLINVTDNQILQETEISGSSETGIRVESKSFKLISGNKLYRVQLKTNTGYEATITSGRIKIVVE